MILSQTGSISSPTHHQRGLYFYTTNYYAILKEHLKILHKLQSTYFQIKIEKVSVMKFQLVENETSFPMRFVLFTDIEML